MFRPLLLCLVLWGTARGSMEGNASEHSGDHHSSQHSDSGHHSNAGIKVVDVNFHHVAVPLLLTAFIIAVIIVKIGFDHTHWLSSTMPESCLLIILGVGLGFIFLLDHSHATYRLLKFDPRSFFLFLLPPIILEAAYSLRDRAFAENFGTIILYAVVGTLLNWLVIGLGLYGLSALGGLGVVVNITLLDCLIFAALISAVDPVAVLAIFQELGVNKMLYFMVFGESLLNDAVTVVLYTVLVTFAHMETITVGDVGLGVLAFVVSSLCAIIIGTFHGLLTGYITKFTGKIRVVEPTALFGMAYLSYLCAELFHFSGIISIICCGLVQSHFAMGNISSKSYVTVHYFSKVLSSITESLIFIILGVMLVNDDYWLNGWSTMLSVYTLVLCLAARFAVVFLLTHLVNRTMAGFRRISRQEQFIMSYGGLRGAVSFSLVFMLSESETKHKDTLMCATYVVILFTVFVQGSTIKPLVKLLRIEKEEGDLKMFGEIQRGVVENLSTGMEEVCGYHGIHFWAAVSHNLSVRFLRPYLQKGPVSKGRNLLNVFAEVEIQSRLADTERSGVTLMTSGSAIWDELNMVDQSPLKSATAESLLDAQDEALRKSRSRNNSSTSVMNAVSPPVPKISFDLVEDDVDKPRSSRRGSAQITAQDVRHLMARPLQRQMHYAAGDRNLKQDRSEMARKRWNHLLRARRSSQIQFPPLPTSRIQLPSRPPQSPSTERSLSVGHALLTSKEDEESGIGLEPVVTQSARDENLRSIADELRVSLLAPPSPAHLVRRPP